MVWFPVPVGAVFALLPGYDDSSRVGEGSKDSVTELDSCGWFLDWMTLDESDCSASTYDYELPFS